MAMVIPRGWVFRFSPALERVFAASTLATGMGAVAFPDNTRLMQVPHVSRMSAVGSSMLSALQGEGLFWFLDSCDVDIARGSRLLVRCI